MASNKNQEKIGTRVETIRLLPGLRKDIAANPEAAQALSDWLQLLIMAVSFARDGDFKGVDAVIDDFTSKHHSYYVGAKEAA